MAGRPRKPTQLHVVQGTGRKCRMEKRKNEPRPDGEVGNPPAFLTKKQQAAWRELVGNSAAGVLTISDRVTLEMAACLLAEYRRKPDAMPATRMTLLERILAKLGMNPADRSRISVTSPEKGENPFAELDR